MVPGASPRFTQGEKITVFCGSRKPGATTPDYVPVPALAGGEEAAVIAIGDAERDVLRRAEGIAFDHCARDGFAVPGMLIEIGAAATRREMQLRSADEVEHGS
jgi:hypothetical protein